MKGFRIRQIHTSPLLLFFILGALLLPIVNAGDAEVSRNKNLQQAELEAGNGDVTRYRDLAIQELAPNNADITRYQNLQYLELQPNNADITRHENLAYLELEPNNADVIRYRNLAYMPLDEVIGYEINITSLMVTDQNGNPRTSFLRGEIARFNATIKNVGSYPLVKGVISVMVLDPTSTPVLFTYTLEDIAVQQTIQAIFGYRILTTTQPGTYMVKVSVFTDWPSQGGIFLNAEISTFTIS